jgi:hypothetical protein
VLGISPESSEAAPGGRAASAHNNVPDKDSSDDQNATLAPPLRAVPRTG